MRRQLIVVVLVAGAAILALLIRAGTGASAAAAHVLTITRGGTYTGSYERIDVNTREPVVIENATLRGRGHLITSSYAHANVTIRNTRGFGMNPNVAGRAAGRFVSLEGFDHVVIENCSLESTGGIYLLDYAGDRSASNTVKILRNRAKNIDGRRSDGKGGYQPGGESASELVQFAQLDKVRNVPGVEIAWNEVVNEPGKSRVEDVINIYLSSGTKDSPIRIHDNFIFGAYPARPAEEEFSGGGILLADGVAKEGAAGDPGFVVAHDNQVLDTVNYGIAISAGHDCTIRDNRIVSAGVLPDGKTPIAAQNVGAYVWDSYKAGKERFTNNSGRGNVIGWVKKGEQRNDWWRPHASEWVENEHYPDPLTLEVYQKEWERWREKVSKAQVEIGARP